MFRSNFIKCLWPIFNDMLKVNDYCRWWRYKIHYALDLYHLRVLTYKIFATDTSDISDVLTTSIIRTMSKQCTRNWIKIQELVGQGRTLAKPMGKGVGGSSDDQWEPEISPSNIPFYLIHHYVVLLWNKMTFELLMVMSMKMAIYWNAAQCTLIQIEQCFRGAYCLHHQGDGTNDKSSNQLKHQSICTWVNGATSQKTAMSIICKRY
jgi:hypothetical protein